MDSSGIKITGQAAGFCRDCNVLYAKANTYYLNGSRASTSSGIYNYHILFLDGTKWTLPYWLYEGQTDLGKSLSTARLRSMQTQTFRCYLSHGSLEFLITKLCDLRVLVANLQITIHLRSNRNVT